MPSDKKKADMILRAIRALDVGNVNLMEVCGTHTMAIAKSGIRTLLPENIRLLSGPGCPVCVTPAELIDGILRLSEDSNIIIATYGDMVRVPGTVNGDSLRRRRALGADVRIVYSPVDAVSIAKENPEREVVFLGVGFETTAPGTAAAVLTAAEEGVKNFSLFSMLKTVEPALRALIKTEGFNVQGFLCPGHVGTIIGERGFSYLAEEFGIPSVVCGFEPEDILMAVYMLLRQIADGRAEVENEYTRAVSENGNALAVRMLDECFEPRFDLWRGLGGIEGSGLVLREKLADFDAQRKFSVPPPEKPRPTACRCGEVITGRIYSKECPMFGSCCTPEEPLGPCMVSSEGACAAAYRYDF